MITGLISGVVGSGSGSSSGPGLTAPTPLKTFDFTDGSGQADSDITFTRASVKWVVGSDGLLQSYANNVWPTEYSAATLKPLGVTRHLAGTNLVTYSEDETNAIFTKTDITVTANAASDPYGTTLSDILTEGSAGTAVISYTKTSLTSNEPYTVSAFLNSNTNEWICATWWDGTNGVRCWYNLKTKTAGTKTVLGSGSRTGFGGIDWGIFGVRLWLTSRFSGTSGTFTVHSADADGSTTRVSGAIYSRFGVQLETGTTPTSYMPSLGSSGTRAVESATIASINSKSWFSASAGVAIFDTTTPLSGSIIGQDGLLAYFSTAGADVMRLQIGDEYGGGRWNILVQYGGSTVVDKYPGTTLSSMNARGVFARAAIGWGLNNYRIMLGDSTTTDSDTSAGLPAFTTLTLGGFASSSPFRGYLKKIRFYGDLSTPDLRNAVKDQEQEFYGAEQLIGHGSIITRNVTNSGGNVAFQQMLLVRPVTGASKLKLVDANVKNGVSALECNPGQLPYTLKASLQWGGTDTSATMHARQFLWDGSASIQVQPGEIVESDEIDVNIPEYAGTPTWIVYNKTFASAPTQYTTSDHFLDNGGGNNEVSATSLTDRTMTQGWASGFAVNRALFPPIGLLARVQKRRPVVAIMGDSISCSGQSYGTLGYDVGYAQMGLTGAKCAWLGVGHEGKAGLEWSADQDAVAAQSKAWEMMRTLGVTHILYALGINDLAYGGSTTASMLRTLSKITVKAAEYGIEVIPITLTPKTNAGNTAERVGEPGTWVKRADYNTAIRAMDKHLDVASVSEDGSTNLWRTDLGTPTADGIHPGTAVHNAMRDLLIAKAPTLFGIVTP